MSPIPTATVSPCISARASTPIDLRIEPALAYARKHGLEACLIVQAGEVLAEIFDGGFSPDQAHALYSGTKSFWGPLAIRAEQDGLFTLDERACATIPELNNDAQKRHITIRMLLSLTAGYGFGGLGNAVPTYEQAIGLPLKDDPGAVFTYGGSPLQVFGALVARKLAARNMTPHDYLYQRLLEPAGVTVESWRKLKDGTQPFPTGAFLTANNWLAYGRYVGQHRNEFAACFQGSRANAHYGLGWWLGLKAAPEDLVYASGSGGQALYVVPSLDLVLLHFGKSASYKSETFMCKLFGNA